MRTKKEEYIDKLAGRLKGWSARIDELEGKAAGAASNVKADYEARVRELKDKRDRLSGRLQELKGSGSDAWTALKAGVEAATKDLAEAIKAAKDKFRKAA